MDKLDDIAKIRRYVNNGSKNARGSGRKMVPNLPSKRAPNLPNLAAKKAQSEMEDMKPNIKPKIPRIKEERGRGRGRGGKQSRFVQLEAINSFGLSSFENKATSSGLRVSQKDLKMEMKRETVKKESLKFEQETEDVSNDRREYWDQILDQTVPEYNDDVLYPVPISKAITTCFDAKLKNTQKFETVADPFKDGPLKGKPFILNTTPNFYRMCTDKVNINDKDKPSKEDKDTPKLDNNGKTICDGFIGKIRLYASGKVELVVGEVVALLELQAHQGYSFPAQIDLGDGKNPGKLELFEPMYNEMKFLPEDV